MSTMSSSTKQKLSLLILNLEIIYIKYIGKKVETRRGEKTFHKLNGVATTRIVHNFIYDQQRYTICNIDNNNYVILISSTPKHVVPITEYQRYVIK